MLLWNQDILRTDANLTRVEAATPQDSLGGELEVALRVKNDRVLPCVQTLAMVYLSPVGRELGAYRQASRGHSQRGNPFRTYAQAYLKRQRGEILRGGRSNDTGNAAVARVQN